jgi:membrane protein
MRDEAVQVGKRFISDIGRDDVAGLSAELAYRFLFALFPFGIFVAALTAFVSQAAGIGDPTSSILGAVGDNLPPDLAAGIRPQLEAVIGTTRPGLLTFGAIAALWAATGGTNALIKAMNRAYEVEEDRPLLPRYALAIGLTLLATIGILVAFVTIVGASLLTDQIVRQLNLNQTVVSVISVLRWPVVFVFLSIAVGILYRLAPNVRTPFRWCVVGGAIFSICWLVVTAAFGFYVANFANYANTYGALGGVIVLMLWLYLSSFVLVGSAALIAAFLKERRPEELRQARAIGKDEIEPTATSVRLARREGAALAADGRAKSTPTDASTADATAAAMRARREGHDVHDDEEAQAKGRPFARTRATERAVPAPIPKPSAAPRARAAATAASLPRRPFARTRYQGSDPEDWAYAATVTGIGATVGILAAWLLRSRPRD